MSMADREAGGATPSAVDIPVSALAKVDPAAALQAAGGAGLALALAMGLIALAQSGKPAVVTARPAVAAPIRTAAPPGPPPAFAAGLDGRAIVQALLRQAGLRPTLDLRRLSWVQARKVNALLPPVKTAPDAPQPFRLDVASRNGREGLRCLTQAAYYEAGANGPEAEAAVAQVVLNRVRHPDFPKSVCGVVYQGAARDTGCQFTFTCDGTMARPVDLAAWNEARKVAERALNGYVVAAIGASTYYHADYVFPVWAPTLQKTATVGPHIFYRMPGSEGSASFLTGRYAGGELQLEKAILRATEHRTQKPELEDKPRVEFVATTADAVPAGLRSQSDRLQRVRMVIAGEAKAPEARNVETASAQPASAADTPPAPAVQTGDAAAPAA